MKSHFLFIAFLAMLTALAGLAGCQPAEVQQSGSESAVSAPPQTVDAEKAPVHMEIRYTDEVSGDMLEIPQIDADGAQDINAALMEIAGRYGEYLEPADEDYESFCEVMALPFTTDAYVSVVMIENVFPTYGTDGTLTSFVFDRENKKQFTLEELTSSGQADEGAIRSSLEAWVAENQMDEDNVMTAEFVELRGFRMCADGTAEVFFSAEQAYEQAGGDTWLGLYSFHNGAVAPLAERYSDYAREIDALDPPLYIATLS